MKKIIKFLEADTEWANFKREFTESEENLKLYREVCGKGSGGELESASRGNTQKKGKNTGLN